MKRVVIVFTSLFLLSACGGNSLGLDKERIVEATRDHAMNNIASVRDKGYEREQVEVIRVCPATEGNDFEHKGDYLVYWQTDDGDNQSVDVMNEDDYEVGFGSNRFTAIEEEDCLEF